MAVNSAATTFAQQQADLLRQQLASYYDNLNAIRDSQIKESEARKKSLLDAIEAKRAPITEQYNADSRQAYINNILGKNSLTDQLSRLGLNSTGFGVTQNSLIDTNYSKILSDLQTTRNNNLQALTDASINAENSFNEELANINTNYLNSKLDLDKYIDTSVRNVYDTAYNNYINEHQPKYSGSSITSTYKPKTYTNTKVPYELGIVGVLNPDGKSVSYTTSNGDKYTLALGINPWTGTKAAGVDLNNIKGTTFSNGYQPNNVGGDALKKSGETIAHPVSGQIQNIWQTKKSGKYYIWDGPSGKYYEVVKKNGNWVVK